VEFDLGIEIAAVEEHFVEAPIAKRALEGVLAATVFLGRGFTAATGALVPGALDFERADGACARPIRA